MATPSDGGGMGNSNPVVLDGDNGGAGTGNPVVPDGDNAAAALAVPVAQPPSMTTGTAPRAPQTPARRGRPAANTGTGTRQAPIVVGNNNDGTPPRAGPSRALQTPTARTQPATASGTGTRQAPIVIDNNNNSTPSRAGPPRRSGPPGRGGPPRARQTPSRRAQPAAATGSRQAPIVIAGGDNGTSSRPPPSRAPRRSARVASAGPPAARPGPARASRSATGAPPAGQSPPLMAGSVIIGAVRVAGAPLPHAVAASLNTRNTMMFRVLPRTIDGNNMPYTGPSVVALVDVDLSEDFDFWDTMAEVRGAIRWAVEDNRDNGNGVGRE